MKVKFKNVSIIQRDISILIFLIVIMFLLNLFETGYIFDFVVVLQYKKILEILTICKLIIFIFMGLIAFYRIYIPVDAMLKAMQKIADGNLTDSKEIEKSFRSFPSASDFLYLLNDMKKKIDSDYSMQILKKQAELNALQSQINPHFLYNTLDAVRSQVMQEGLSETAEMVEALSNFFRYSISGKKSLISFEEELKSLEFYIKIMQYRFMDKFTVIKKFDKNDNILMSYLIPKLTLQPIVENAISHGLELKMGKGTITIRAERTNRMIDVIIEDNGIGIENDILDSLNEKLRKGSTEVDPTINEKNKGGIALVNVNERLKMVFGEKYGLRVSSEPGLGTSVHIIMPLNLNIVEETK